MLKPGKIQLYPSGTMLDLTNLSKHITLPIRDVAYGLSNITRFCGATKEALSVAQHSLSVCHVVNNTLQRWYDPSEHKEFIRAISFAALMHDAHEALGILDMPSPVKHLECMEGYRELELTVQSFVRRLALISDVEAENPLIKFADLACLATEKEGLCAAENEEWGLPFPAIWSDEANQTFNILPAKLVRKDFLEQFDRLKPAGCGFV